jgi:sulfur carrier protein
MQLVINGEMQELAEQTSLTNLLEIYQLLPQRLAIELNHRVIPRKDWPNIYLQPGDQIEIVHFVGGG